MQVRREVEKIIGESQLTSHYTFVPLFYHPPQAVMTPPVGKGVPINEEWAASLIGLRMQVPNLWWKGFEGDEILNKGTIVGVDFNAAKLNYFQLELANEKGAYCAMQYDAVHLYADV
jgi:hypothetical protein